MKKFVEKCFSICYLRQGIFILLHHLFPALVTLAPLALARDRHPQQFRPRLRVLVFLRHRVLDSLKNSLKISSSDASTRQNCAAWLSPRRTEGWEKASWRPIFLTSPREDPYWGEFPRKRANRGEFRVRCKSSRVNWIRRHRRGNGWGSVNFLFRVLQLWYLVSLEEWFLWLCTKYMHFENYFREILGIFFFWDFWNWNSWIWVSRIFV